MDSHSVDLMGAGLLVRKGKTNLDQQQKYNREDLKE